MRTIIIIALIMVFGVPAHAEWTHDDTRYQAAFIAAAVADWGQTLCIANNPDRFYETNFLLGRHPSSDRVNIYFPAAIVLHTVVAVALPPKYRRAWQLVWIGIETSMVLNNASIGIKLDF